MQRAAARWWLILAAMMFAPCACGLLLLSTPGGLVGSAGAASCGPASVPNETSAGWSAEQRANAATIVSVGRAMGVPDRGLIVALVTAMQESTLVNLPGGDRDSAGLFQQRPSQGWGSFDQVTDPAYASQAFFEHLLAVPGWEAMPVAEAAQRVQRSAFPSAYARWEQLATALAGELAGVTSTCAGTTVGGFASPLPAGLIVPPVPEHHNYPAADLPVPVGTQVFAMAGGQVRLVDEAGGCGWGVAIVDGPVEWMFCHGSARSVRSGDVVSAGQPVMLSGGAAGAPGAGSSSGPHLHVQVRVAGSLRCVQPMLDALAVGQAPPPVESLPATWPCVG